MAADPSGEQRLDALVAAVAGSPRYRAVSPTLIAALGRRELARRPSLAAAIKGTKSALHQAGGAYLEPRMPYSAWLQRLARAHAGADEAELRATCRLAMRHHASTRERLPVLETFYATALADLPPIQSVIDVACGLNPLAAPWMNLAAGATYRALDIYADMAAFLGAALPLLGLSGRAEVCDIVHTPVAGSADVALLLKVLPLLEHQGKGAGLRLLRALDVPLLLVSFPARSLGGHDRGMPRTYEESFQALAAAEGWTLRRHAFPTELAFLVRK